MTSRVESVLSLTAQEKRGLLQVLGDVNELTRDVFSLKLTEAQWRSVPAIANAVAYQGFDPMRVIREFTKERATDADKSTQTVTVGDSTVKVCVGTDPGVDLLFFLTLFVTRGNNVAKILLKCDSSVKDIIARKCSQYGISTVAKSSKTPLGPSVITLARLSQAFAPATAAVIMGHDVMGNLKTKLFPGVVLPLIMTHTIFPAILRETDTELIEIAKFLNLEMSIMLSAPKEKRRMMSATLSDLFEQSDSFVMAAVNGSVTGPSVKAKALIKANLIMTDGTLSKIVQAMAAMCGRLHSMMNDTYSGAVDTPN